MNKKIKVTTEYDIVTSECGEFCGKACDGIAMERFCCIAHRPSRLTVENGNIIRTEFCKKNEVKNLEDNKICQTLLKEYSKP